MTDAQWPEEPEITVREDDEPRQDWKPKVLDPWRPSNLSLRIDIEPAKLPQEPEDEPPPS